MSTAMTENVTVDLEQLLARLENTLLSPTADDSALRATPYERSRIGANIEYARTLLLRLDHDSRDIKTTTRRQSFQATLQTKRDLIKRLNQRLHDLNTLATSDDESSSDEEDEGTRVREFAPAVPTHDTLDTETPPSTEDSNLRARKPTNNNTLNSNAPADAATTSALFGSRTASNPTLSSTQQNSANTNTILDSSTQDQALLTSSLVSLAQSLKLSSQQFAASLEDEKSVLKRAEAGLDKNAMGMEAAGNRMTTLRRMTEGQGWWGRVKLYAIIAALWVAAFLLVFAGPKLRF